MHIHRFEQFWIWLSIILIAGFVATIVIGFTNMNLRVIGAHETVDLNNLSETPFGKPGIRKIVKDGKTHYEVYVLDRQFLFMPGTGTPIIVPAGIPITFYIYITSPDVIHGFHIVGTNLNTMVIPGQVAKFTTVFPKPATYGIVCNEYCGLAHHVMEGVIKVVPKSEFKEELLVKWHI